MAPNCFFESVQVGCQLCLRGLLRGNHLKCLTSNRSVGSRSPGQNFTGQLVFHRRKDVASKVVIGPARVTEIPGLEMAVLETPLFHLLDDPLPSRLKIWSSGQ